jgi:C4-dicarboxylate-binding protein DctP
VTLKFGTVIPQGDNPESNALAAFKKTVEEKTKGEVRVQLFPGGQLGGGGRAAVEAVQQGVADLYLSSDADLAGLYPPVQLLSAPYLFSNAESAHAFFVSPFAMKLSEQIRSRTGVRTLVMTELGFRSFTSGKRLFVKPEDIKGLRIRVQESPIYLRMIESLGASPTPIPSTELLMALKQGVVDGAENALSVIHDFGMADVQKYVTINEHVMGVLFVIMNDDVYSKLKPDHQSAVDDAAVVLSQVVREQKAARKADYIQKIRAKGAEVHESTVEQKAAFRAAMQKPVLDYLAERLGRPMVDELLATTAAK